MSLMPTDRKALLVLKEAMRTYLKNDIRFITPIRHLEEFLVMPDDMLRTNDVWLRLMGIVLISRLLISDKKISYGEAATVGVLTHYLPVRIETYRRDAKINQSITLIQFLSKDVYLCKLIKDSFWLPNNRVDYNNLKWFNDKLNGMGYKATINADNEQSEIAAALIKIQFTGGTFHLERDKCRLY